MKVFDTGMIGAGDRYTVLFENGDALCFSANPGYPQGIAQMSKAIEGPHLGIEVAFRDLPWKAQVFVARRLAETEKPVI